MAKWSGDEVAKCPRERVARWLNGKEVVKWPGRRIARWTVCQMATLVHAHLHTHL